MVDILNHDQGTKFPLSAILKERAYTLLSEKDYNTLVGYDELTTALGLDPQLDTRARFAILRAGRDLLRDQKKKLVNVRNLGYRIAQPTEQVTVSQREQARARRWYRRAAATVTHVMLEGLPPTEVAKIMLEQARVGMQLAMSQRLARTKQLPPKEQLALPSSRKLIELFRKSTKTKAG